MRKATAFGAALGILASTATAQAQDVNLNQFEPAPVGDRAYGVQGPDARGDALLRAMLLLDYAHDPLVLENQDGDEVGSVVNDQFFAHLNGSFALMDRFLFSVNLPVALIQAGDQDGGNALVPGLVSPDGAALGDLRLGARARLLGPDRDGFQLGLGGYLWVPTGSDRYTGADGISGRPSVMVGGNDDTMAWSAEVGVMLRPTEQILNETPVGSAITFGGGLFFLLDDAKTVQVGPELYGSHVLAGDGGNRTNLEVLGDVRWRPGGGPFVFGLGAGPGLGTGAGTPDYRVVAMFAFSPEEEGVGSGDRDGDGVRDEDDACPDDAGVKTPDPKTNGCPAPPGDRDADGVPDEEDKCPDDWGEKANQGCPKDTDQDGVPDWEDACPDTKGIRHEDPRHNGCPRARVEQTGDAIVISETVKFEHGKAEIKEESYGLLDDVARVMKENPDIEEVEVQGHTDDTGPAFVNTKLSQDRADAVRDYLIEKGGIEPGRLRAKGYGPDKPIAGNDSDSGRAANRRVEFKILKGPGIEE